MRTWGAFVLLATLAPAQARAFETMVILVPNPVLAENGAGRQVACITCHDNADGGAGCVRGGGKSPCLNPFGRDFGHSEVEGTASRVWTPVLAQIDSDLDGFTNGQELQDFVGAWKPGQPAVGKLALATSPGNPQSNPGLVDADGDGFCAVGHDLDGDGDCTETVENDGGHDCLDGDETVHSDAVESCADGIDNDCDGLTDADDPTCGDIIDRDRDGFCPRGVDKNGDGDCIDRNEGRDGVEDCDDAGATTYPRAPENCIDARDNDCDALIDRDDDDCTALADADHDGHCPYGIDGNGDGDCIDPDESVATSDCDDGDAEVGPHATENCRDLRDNDCDGDATFDDADCRQLVDRDGDGVCPVGRDLNGDGNCAGDGEDASGADCNDEDPLVSPDVEEQCLAAGDADCDGLAGLRDPDCERFTDLDGDRYCTAGEDLDDDGECVTSLETTGASDCDDSLRVVHPGATEVCDDQVDNDCDGSRDAHDPACRDYADADGDGRCKIGRDRNGDGDCSDDGEQNGERGDCDDGNATVHREASENCFDELDNDCNGDSDLDDDACRRDVDADGDGFCPVGRDLSTPPDGDCEDRGENFRLSDCNDRDARVRPDVGESCTDHIDNNCNGAVDLSDEQCARVLDRDRDHYCEQGEDLNGDGDCIDANEHTDASDCADLDGTRRPGGREQCDNGRDDDCDRFTDSADSDCSCEGDADCVHWQPCFIGSCRSAVGTDEQTCVYRPVARCVPEPGDAGTEPPLPDASATGSAPDLAPPDAAVSDGADAAAVPGGSESSCSCGVAGADGSESRGARVLATIALCIVCGRRRRRRYGGGLHI